MTLLALLFAAAPTTVAVDLTALDRQSYQDLDAVSLERSVVVRLVQEGFAVVSATAEPQIRIRLTRKGRSVQLSAGDQLAQVDLEPKRLREFHLEVAQKAVQLARAVVIVLAEPQPAPSADPPPQSAPAPVAPPPEHARVWNVLAAGGVLIRAPGFDARIAVAARYAATSRLGIHVEVGLTPIPGADFTAYDGTLQLGAGVQLTGGLFRLELGLSLGVMSHVYTVSAAIAQEPVGSRLDFIARPFLRGTLNPVSGLLVWAQFGAGLTSRAREHRYGGAKLYERGAPWLDAVVGLGWET